MVLVDSRAYGMNDISAALRRLVVERAQPFMQTTLPQQDVLSIAATG